MSLPIEFSEWNCSKILWSEIALQRNTGKKYTHKQDLVAVFFNSYQYYKIKFARYYAEFQRLPNNYINELIFEFRDHFPIKERISDINYFDDLLILLSDKYRQKQKKLNCNDQQS